MSLVQFSSVTQSCPTLCDPMDCSTPGFTVHHQLPELTLTHVHWVGNAIQTFHPLSYPSPPTFNLSQQQGLFKWVSSSHQVCQSIEVPALALVLPMNNQGWFPLGWTGLLAVQGTLKNFPQHHSSKASILQCTAFFMVQHSHPYITMGETIALTRQIFLWRMSLLLICCLGWSQLFS